MISIILPTYNRAHVLMRAVNSVLCQTYQDIELLIVDDGSNDRTRQIAEQIDDKRVRIFYQRENHGACAARNKGILAARGEYIAFQDSDDVWYPEKLERQLAYLQETNSDLVFCAFYRYDGKTVEYQPGREIREGNIAYHDLLVRNLISTQTLMGKRSCFQEEMFDETYPRLQDWELALRMARRFKISYDPQPLVDVYLQRDSISSDPRKGLWAIERLTEQHRKALEEDSRGAIGMAFTYAHFARACGMNPWTGFFRIIKKAPMRMKARALGKQVKESVKWGVHRIMDKGGAHYE